MSEKYVVPIWGKYSLTIEEAAAYFRIGEQKLRRIADENANAPYLLWNRNRPQFKKNLKNTWTD